MTVSIYNLNFKCSSSANIGKYNIHSHLEHLILGKDVEALELATLSHQNEKTTGRDGEHVNGQGKRYHTLNWAESFAEYC